jgi:putative ABC transport system permease protein
VTLFRLIVWRHLFREPLRTTLTAVGVGLGVAVYIAIASANVEVLRSFEEAVVGVTGRTTLQIRSASGLAGGFDERTIAAVQNAEGVRFATPVLELNAVWQPVAGPAVVIPILAVDLLAESSFRQYTVTSAELSESDWERLLEPDAIFMGRTLARRHGLKPGVVIDVNVGPLRRRLTVRGILEASGTRAAALEQLAVMDIAAAQFTFDRLGTLDRVDIISEAAVPVAAMQEKLQANLPPDLIVTRPEQRNAQVERMTRAFRLNVASLSAVALLVGLFLVYNTMSFAVVRRRREIGILRALGMLPRDIGRLFIVEAIAVGLIGWGLGVIGGMFLAKAAIRAITTTSGNLYDLAMHPSSIGIPPGVMTQSLLVGLGVALFGSIGPIRAASSINPVQALAPKGYETVQSSSVRPALLKAIALLSLAGLAALLPPLGGLPIFGYVSALLLLIAFAVLTPLTLRASGLLFRALLPRRLGYLPAIAAGELERAPVRSAVAVSALMVGLALMIGMMILIQSFRKTVDAWLEQTVKADLIVAAPTWLSGPHSLLPASLLTRLAGLPGVAAMDAYHDLRMDFRGRPVAVVARDLQIHARHSRYLFIKGDSPAVLASAVRNNRVIVSETFANQFKLGEGDTVTLPSARGPVELTIAGVFYDYATDGGKVVMDRSVYERYWQDPNLTVIPLYLAPAADPEHVRNEILRRLAGGPAIMVISNRELKREVLRIFDQTFAITYALELIAVVVALLGIINALLSGILERQRELAVLRAIGGSPAQISRLIVWESGLLGVVGCVLGTAAGILLSILLIQVINKQSFGWTIVFHAAPFGVMQAVALALITTVLAGYGPGRRAAKLPVAESLQYE